MNILRITYRMISVLFVVAALSAPVATASPVEERLPSLADRETTAPPTSSPDTYLANQGVDLGSAPEAPAAVATSSEGFDWGDAGIGAAAMVAIAAITGGVAVELGRRRRPRVA